MPELPEVETTLRGIAPYVEQQVIHHLIVRQPQLRWPVPETLEQLIAGHKIHALDRRGKYLLIELEPGTLIIHLGMSGSLRILTEAKPAEKHDHLDFIFANGMVMRYHDPRRFGTVLWTEQPVHQHPLLKDLGPEPLLSDFDGKHLYKLSRNRKTPVKNFIMDSHIVVGVGNIYANEALFLAGIQPSRHAGRISLTRYRLLADCIKTVLQNAIEQGGTTLRNFVNETGSPGYFKQQLQVYGRAGLPCLRCQTTLFEIRLNNRTTVFCSKCQK